MSQETNGAASPESTALLALLRSEGIDAALIAPGCPMPTVARAAAAIGVSEEQIVKSLLFQDAGGRLVLAIAAGTARVDRRLLAKAAQLDRPRLADPATVLDATGYPAGGVPPVGHRTAIPVVIDRRAAALAIAFGGGGTEDLLLRIRPLDIIRLTNARVADIVAVGPFILEAPRQEGGRTGCPLVDDREATP